MKYIITNDHRHFLTLTDKDMSYRLADNIQGAVYLCSAGEMYCIYSHKDED